MAEPRVLSIHTRQILRNGKIEFDDWARLADDAPLPERGAVAVSLARLTRERVELVERDEPFGVYAKGDAEPEEIVEANGGSLEGLGQIAIEVPKFSDGRHFSLARLLRERFGFAGELRVFGDVLPDQLFYMKRCGYTAFELRADKSLATGLRALQAFSVSYQAAADDPRPLYRRR